MSELISVKGEHRSSDGMYIVNLRQIDGGGMKGEVVLDCVTHDKNGYNTTFINLLPEEARKIRDYLNTLDLNESAPMVEDVKGLNGSVSDLIKRVEALENRLDNPVKESLPLFDGSKTPYARGVRVVGSDGKVYESTGQEWGQNGGEDDPVNCYYLDHELFPHWLTVTPSKQV